MATHGIAHISVKRGKIVGFGENSLTQRTNDITTLGRVFNEKNDFIHALSLVEPKAVRKHTSTYELAVDVGFFDAVVVGVVHSAHTAVRATAKPVN